MKQKSRKADLPVRLPACFSSEFGVKRLVAESLPPHHLPLKTKKPETRNCLLFRHQNDLVVNQVQAVDGGL